MSQNSRCVALINDRVICGRPARILDLYRAGAICERCYAADGLSLDEVRRRYIVPPSLPEAARRDRDARAA